MLLFGPQSRQSARLSLESPVVRIGSPRPLTRMRLFLPPPPFWFHGRRHTRLRERVRGGGDALIRTKGQPLSVSSTLVLYNPTSVWASYRILNQVHGPAYVLDQIFVCKRIGQRKLDRQKFCFCTRVLPILKCFGLCTLTPLSHIQSWPPIPTLLLYLSADTHTEEYCIIDMNPFLLVSDQWFGKFWNRQRPLILFREKQRLLSSVSTLSVKWTSFYVL
jgi:hypothetical protein